MRESLEIPFADPRLLLDLLVRRVLVLDGFVSAERLIFSVVIISHAIAVLPRTFVSIPPKEIVAISASRKSATVTAEDVLPARISTYPTTPWIFVRSFFVVEVVVVTVDP